MEVMLDAPTADTAKWPDPNESSAEFEIRIVGAVELQLARLRAKKAYVLND